MTVTQLRGEMIMKDNKILAKPASADGWQPTSRRDINSEAVSDNE